MNCGSCGLDQPSVGGDAAVTETPGDCPQADREIGRICSVTVKMPDGGCSPALPHVTDNHGGDAWLTMRASASPAANACDAPAHAAHGG